MAEFLVEVEIDLTGLPIEQRSSLVAAEAGYGRAMMEAGVLGRIWRIPGRHANVAIWVAADATELHARLAGLPMFEYATIAVTALAIHPLEAGTSPDGGPGGLDPR